MSEEYKPTPQEEAIFREVVHEMYENALKNNPDLQGYVTCGIDVESPEGLLKLVTAINAKPN